MPDVSATIDKSLYEECKAHAQWRFGANGRMSDYVRTALVQLARRDTASQRKSARAKKVPEALKDSMRVHPVQGVASKEASRETD